MELELELVLGSGKCSDATSDYDDGERRHELRYSASGSLRIPNRLGA